MKTFRQFINERVNYHIARGKQDPLKGRYKKRLIWFAHDKHLKTGIRHWYLSDYKRSGKHTPDVYTAKIKGKIAHHGDPKVKKIIHNTFLHDKDHHGPLSHQDLYHYHLNIGKAETIGDHPITKTLKKHGYVGYRHPEVETGTMPGDQGTYAATKFRDHESTLVFDRKHVSLKKQKSPEIGPQTKARLDDGWSYTPYDYREGNMSSIHKGKKIIHRMSGHDTVKNDITHTYPLKTRMKFKKHNVRVTKDTAGDVEIRKKDTGELHSVDNEPSLHTAHNGWSYWHKNGQTYREKQTHKGSYDHFQKDVTHTYPPHKQKLYKKHNMHVLQLDGEGILTRNNDTNKLHSINDEPSLITLDRKAWHKNGKLHRDGNKPAIIHLDGTHEYYRNGEQYQPKGKKQQ